MAKASHRKGVKRAAYRPEFKEDSVEVINGSSTNHVVFNEGKKPAESGKEQSSQIKVEVVNGTSTDTQYFYAGNDKRAQNAAAIEATGGGWHSVKRYAGCWRQQASGGDGHYGSGSDRCEERG